MSVNLDFYDSIELSANDIICMDILKSYNEGNIKVECSRDGCHGIYHDYIDITIPYLSYGELDEELANEICLACEDIATDNANNEAFAIIETFYSIVSEALIVTFEVKYE